MKTKVLSLELKQAIFKINHRHDTSSRHSQKNNLKYPAKERNHWYTNNQTLNRSAKETTATNDRI